MLNHSIDRNAVHSVGVNNGVKDAVHRFTHCPCHIGMIVSGGTGCQMIRTHHTVYQIGTSQKHLGHIHIRAGRAIPHIGNNNACQTAFIAQEVGAKPLLHTTPMQTHTVEGQHNAACSLHRDIFPIGRSIRSACDCNGQLKCAHINFADTLLIGPCADATTKIFLIVQTNMLIVYI